MSLLLALYEPLKIKFAFKFWFELIIYLMISWTIFKCKDCTVKTGWQITVYIVEMYSASISSFPGWRRNFGATREWYFAQKPPACRSPRPIQTIIVLFDFLWKFFKNNLEIFWNGSKITWRWLTRSAISLIFICVCWFIWTWRLFRPPIIAASFSWILGWNVQLILKTEEWKWNLEEIICKIEEWKEKKIDFSKNWEDLTLNCACRSFWKVRISALASSFACLSFLAFSEKNE